MKQKKFSSPSRQNSFRYAVKGIQKFFREEPNARIHLLATVVVFIVAGYLKVSGTDLVVLVLAMGLVWITEIFNTVIERIVDFISPGYHETAGAIKDMSAAAVLVSAVAAAVCGFIIFLPKIF